MIGYARRFGQTLEDVNKVPGEVFGRLMKDVSQRIHKETLERLQGLQGAEFDQAYANLMIVEHAQAIAFLDCAREYVDDENVRKVIEESIPRLEQHRDAALKAAKSASTGGQMERGR